MVHYWHIVKMLGIWVWSLIIRFLLLFRHPIQVNRNLFCISNNFQDLAIYSIQFVQAKIYIFSNEYFTYFYKSEQVHNTLNLVVWPSWCTTIATLWNHEESWCNNWWYAVHCFLNIINFALLICFFKFPIISKILQYIHFSIYKQRFTSVMKTFHISITPNKFIVH